MPKLSLQLAAICLFPLLAFAQDKNARQEYSAGFTTLYLTDNSRIYKPGTNTIDNLHRRPVVIDLWYPARRTKQETPMRFSEFLKVFLDRPNFYKGVVTPDSTIAQTAQAFCDMNHCSDTARLLNFKTASLKDAPKAKGKFPLIIYMASYGSSCFENYTLLETLAQRGFVVAAISSAGRYPGDMTMKKEDLMQQVYDARFAVNHLSHLSNIDSSKIGIAGYSWGGLAGVVLAGKLNNTACVISLDGSEFHHYGTSKEEDGYFDDLVESPDFKTLRLSVPYLRLEQDPPKKDTTKKDSVYNFNSRVSNGMILKVDSAEHYHFCCLGLVINESGDCAPDRIFPTVMKLTNAFLEDHLKQKEMFAGVLQELINKKVSVKPAEAN